MDNKQDVKKQFARSADYYVHSTIHQLGGDLTKLTEMADLTGKEKLLDVATGGGHTANAFAPFVQEVTAFDLTKEMLSAAEKFIESNGHKNVIFVEGDAERMPFPDASFDVVTCRIAPHHFPNVESFISEVYRVLKSGGQLLLDDNTAPEKEVLDHFYNYVEKMRDYSHFRAWKKSEWIQMLELSGLEIQELHRFEKTFAFETWCDRMHLTSEEKSALNNYMLKASDEVRNKFRIQLHHERVTAFDGEAVLLKAIK